MTAEEMEAKMAALEAKNAELEAKIPAPVAPVDPDAAYKPGSWKGLHDTVGELANAAAVKVLQEAETKKETERKKQDEELATQNKKIEDTFEKLEKEGILKPTTSVSDEGGRQRAQVLGALVSLGGQQLENAVKLAKSAWDNGQELAYDRDSNTVSLVRAGDAPNPNRDAFVGSSAGRVAAPLPKGQINLRGVNGDLGEARRRWELSNGKA